MAGAPLSGMRGVDVGEAGSADVGEALEDEAQAMTGVGLRRPGRVGAW